MRENDELASLAKGLIDPLDLVAGSSITMIEFCVSRPSRVAKRKASASVFRSPELSAVLNDGAGSPESARPTRDLLTRRK